MVTLTVSSFTDILDTIIPFFETYVIIGDKHIDYINFCKIALLMKEKSHITEEGLNFIRNLKSNMNRNRRL
jgi:hypothetical protein